MSVGSIFKSIESFFKKILGNEAKVEQTIAGVLAVATPLLSTVIALVAGAPVAAAVTTVINQAMADLAAVNAVVTGAGGGSATSTSLLNAVKSNLQELLTDAGVKNAAKFSEIETVVNTVITEVEAILGKL